MSHIILQILRKKGVISADIWDINLSEGYYHEVLEPLFFSTLNTPKESRDYEFLSQEIQGILREIPYLNGGLFSPQGDDFYDNSHKNSHINTLQIPNALFSDFFATLDKYHFTIDEASQSAEEVALDPELLGQIFESLLSELFTDNKLEKLDKSSLRKATGSFYTPREIVRYMVKSSLQNYLANALNSPQIPRQIQALVMLSFRKKAKHLYRKVLKIEIFRLLRKLKITNFWQIQAQI